MMVIDHEMPYSLHRITPFWWNRDVIMVEPILDPYMIDLDSHLERGWVDCVNYIATRLGLDLQDIADLRGWQRFRAYWSIKRGKQWVTEDWDYPGPPVYWGTLDPP